MFNRLSVFIRHRCIGPVVAFIGALAAGFPLVLLLAVRLRISLEVLPAVRLSGSGIPPSVVPPDIPHHCYHFNILANYQ